jgi:2-polyprenyl-3-methyl-5-hydroxy-6-metoxy-1,4-benzoquinol methylase
MTIVDQKRITGFVTAVMEKYWSGRYAEHLITCEARRYAFHATLILEACSEGGTVCDIGGGWGILSAACSEMGLRCYLDDDFSDQGFYDTNDPRHRMPSDYSFSKIAQDVTTEPPPFAANSLDVVSSFDSIEHWHRSPKSLLRQVMDMLRPGGTLIIGVPNCVNLRKRLTVPFGYGKWSGMADWYETPVFRGHVREPDVDDLQYIAYDLGLTNVRILGRNWAGLQNDRAFIRMSTLLMDPLLRNLPSVCSDIYMIGQKSR